MTKITFNALISLNKIIFDDPELFRRYCTSMSCKRVSVSMQPFKGDQRSVSQNAYYWGVLVSITRDAISEEYGEQIDLESAHELLKERCNFKELVKEYKPLKITLSTAKLSTVEFNDYIERCRQFVFNWFQIDIPLPNEIVGVIPDAH